jgi:hypothetical protein
VQQSLLAHKAEKRPLLEIIRGATINLLFVAFLAATEEAEASGDYVDHHLGSNIQAVAAAVDEGGGLDIQLAHPSSLTFHILIQGFEASP